jgi:hypothetical protein
VQLRVLKLRERAREGPPLSLHVHQEYAPPRSWEQFEELCADIFQSIFNDPTLVRNGRSGQRQNGVDIVCRDGAVLVPEAVMTMNAIRTYNFADLLPFAIYGGRAHLNLEILMWPSHMLTQLM